MITMPGALPSNWTLGWIHFNPGNVHLPGSFQTLVLMVLVIKKSGKFCVGGHAMVDGDGPAKIDFDDFDRVNEFAGV